MAAKGSEEKNIITSKLMEIFPNAFEHEKVLRIPINGVEIKVALTCAKDNVLAADAVPADNNEAASAPLEPTPEELEEVNSILGRLGF